MPDLNITQMQPEIPNAESAPKRVTNSTVPQTPYFSPSIVTSSLARKQAKKDLQDLSKLTGINYQF